MRTSTRLDTQAVDSGFLNMNRYTIRDRSRFVHTRSTKTIGRFTAQYAFNTVHDEPVAAPRTLTAGPLVKIGGQFTF